MLDELAELGAGLLHAGESCQRLHSHLNARQRGLFQMADELDSGRRNPAGLHRMAHAALLHIHRLRSAADA